MPDWLGWYFVTVVPAAMLVMAVGMVIVARRQRRWTPEQRQAAIERLDRHWARVDRGQWMGKLVMFQVSAGVLFAAVILLLIVTGHAD